MTEDARLIETFYRGILEREPDADGLASHTAALASGTSAADILRGFLTSQEFLSRHRGTAVPFIDRDPPLAISRALSAAQIAALWARIGQTWAALGEQDPFWSVVSNERFHAGQMQDAAIFNEFYRSGQGDVERLDAWLRRNRLALRTDMVCAEYGSGVGRVSVWLARRCKQLRCFDISAQHQRLADLALRRCAIANAELIQVRRPHDLNRLAGIDLFVSSIVLQHNPPPLIGLILDQAFRHLRPGGLAFFQVPTYAAGYSFDTETYLASSANGMEMHCLPQQDVFALAERHGLKPLEIEQDASIGDWGVSHCFLLRKVG